MTEVKKTIQLDAESYTSAPVEVQVPYQGGELTLYVHELGFMHVQKVYANGANDPNFNSLATLMVECVRNADGDSFTMEDVLRLKPEVAKPLLDAVIKVQGLNKPAEGDQKN